MPDSRQFRRAERISHLDRPWLNHWAVVAFTPVAVPDVTVLRSRMVDFMEAHPRHPLNCTLDDNGRRWRPVGPQDRLRHVQEVIVEAESFDDQDPFGYLKAHRPASGFTGVFKVIVGPDSMCFYFAHAAGDAVVYALFFLRMTVGDVDALKPLRPRSGIVVAARMCLTQARSHWRDWWHHLRSAEAPPTPPSGAAPVGACSAVPESDAVGALISAADVEAFKEWRQAHRADVSLIALVTAATYRALADQGVPMNGDGFYTLIDLRRYLPKRDAMRPGNLAKSVYLSADLDEPADIAESLKYTVKTARAVPALFCGAIPTVRRKATSDSAVAGSPVTLIFNWLSNVYGIDLLPWTAPEKARFFQLSYPISANAISVTAIQVRGGIEVSASFDPRGVDRDAVTRALVQLRDMPALLGAANPPTVGVEVRA